MEPRDLIDASRDTLSRLLELDRSDAPPWDAADLQAILCHQLEAQVEFDLTHFGGVAKETMASVHVPHGAKVPCTFGQVLTDPDPAPEMLDMIRRFAKRCRTRQADGMPEEVATVLYYAAIATARLRQGASNSKLDDEALLAGLGWGLQQPWLAVPLRDLFSEAVAFIRSGEPEADV